MDLSRVSRCVYLKEHHVLRRFHLKRSFSKVYFFRKIWSNYPIYPGLIGVGDRNFSKTMVFIIPKKIWQQKEWFSNFCGKNVMCLKDLVTRSLGCVFEILIVRIHYKTLVKNLKLDKNLNTCQKIHFLRVVEKVNFMLTFVDPTSPLVRWNEFHFFRKKPQWEKLFGVS